VTSSAGGRPLLHYTYRLTYPVRVDEALTVYDDGGVWYWSLVPLDRTRRDRVGTFAFRVPTEEQRELKSMVSDLLSVPEEQRTQQRNAPEVMLRVPGDDGERSFLLSTEEGLTGPLVAAWKLGGELRERAELAPLGVIRLGWRPAGPPLRASEPGTVAFTCENLGVEPVSVLFRGGTFSIFAADGSGGWARLWQAVEGQTMGLTDDSGAMIDGVLTPATLRPGASAVAVFMNALEARTAGKQHLGASAEGSITLIRPEGADGFPSADFLLESQPVEVEIAG
jgi:hypothetical protein